MAVSFAKNQDEITKAWRSVVDSKESQEWALFGYEGATNNITLISTGSDGLRGLVHEFNCSLIQYAFCRVINKETSLNKLVLINWQGESSPLSRKGICASHVNDVANYFKGCTQTITIRNDDEANEEYLMSQIMRSSSTSKISIRRHEDSSLGDSGDIPPPVASTYKKTDIKKDISADRKSFWQRQEEEEKERLQEEKRRALEKQAQFERERKMREESEAKKLADTIKERDRIIEATRQAERQDPTGSQPSSMLSNNDNDDGRVGRRSELIRLERNQETQSLISKGLIKNKRAIFEQAAQQQQNSSGQQSSAVGSLNRRPSGSMISQRLNAFQSLESGVGSCDSSNASSSVAITNTNVEKLTNGFSKKVDLNNDTGRTAVVKKEIESVKITNDDADNSHCSSTVEASGDTEAKSKTDTPTNKMATQGATTDQKQENSIVNDQVEAATETNGRGKMDSDVNGNENSKIIKGQSEQAVTEQSKILNSDGSIKAKALYDYQASDNTEISFDPDDLIGFIDKVDSGWWHGSVLTGQYKGQSGLFPSNYVEELNGA